MQGFVGNIEKLTLNNKNFRKVIHTGQHEQLVLMSLKPKEAIGSEVHEIVDQFIRVEKGEGKLVLGGKDYALTDGSAFIVPAGTRHNVINESTDEEMKLYTVYSPPHHRDGTIHKTKKEADADKGDHI